MVTLQNAEKQITTANVVRGDFKKTVVVKKTRRLFSTYEVTYSGTAILRAYENHDCDNYWHFPAIAVRRIG